MKMNRNEIVFLYDLTYANANGDPMDANKPRVDEETGINISTDVRLKRTIRDELFQRGFEILIRDTKNDAGKLADGKTRSKDFKPAGKDDKVQWVNNVLDNCIDVRLFGCTLPLDKDSITFTGPVQFKMGYSMHPVKIQLIKGTGAFASTDNKDNKTFRQEYVTPYSLLCYYGIINERAAEDTHLSSDDVDNMLSAMWEGTANLISRTKAGQTPRLLIVVEYKEKMYHIGELDKYIKFEYGCEAEGIRDINDGKLIVGDLVRLLVDKKDKIEKVRLRLADRMTCDVDLTEELEKNSIEVEMLR